MKRSNIKRSKRVSKKRSGGGRWFKTKAQKEAKKEESRLQKAADERAAQWKLDLEKLGTEGLVQQVASITATQERTRVAATGGSRVSKSKKRNAKRSGKKVRRNRKSKSMCDKCGKQRGGSCAQDYEDLGATYDNYKEQGMCPDLHEEFCGGWLGCLTDEGKCKFIADCNNARNTRKNRGPSKEVLASRAEAAQRQERHAADAAFGQGYTKY
jgi:hypothetical protein